MTYFCLCGEPMVYNIPRDESAPPYCECKTCGIIATAYGVDPAYTSSTIHRSLKEEYEQVFRR